MREGRDSNQKNGFTGNTAHGMDSGINSAHAYNLSIGFLAPRARSVNEMREYLVKKGFDENILVDTINRLIREKLLDDRAFAAQFVEHRERLNPKSRFALKFELKKKGIDSTIIEESLVDIDEFRSAWHGVESKLRTWQSCDDDKFKKKVMNFLKNRGFGYEVSISTFEKAYEKRHHG
ncbi:MAG: regulatory protein RecX [Desulfamplus sp.]|nr:regulatory protein RecX [Desulfamplus sp.]